MRRLAWAVSLWLVAAGGPAVAEEAMSVHGDLSLDLPGVSLADAGPIVVYLEPVDGTGAPGTDLVPARLVQTSATFSPAFQVVVAGQTVQMPNNDRIYHNVFSYSKANEFDLGMYPSGESRSVRFDHPGVVKVYCSIHEDMNATIVVAPTRHFVVLAGEGRFSIDGVSPGRYRLRTWSEKLPALARDVSVGPAAPAAIDLVIRSRPD